jgi:hypothetical protein
MVMMINQQTEQDKSKSGFKTLLIFGVAALVLGAICGAIYGRQTAQGGSQNRAMNEIIVSQDQGLLFKSEDGTPLLRIQKDSWGTRLALLSSDGTPLVELNNLQGAGGISVGSKAGRLVSINAHEHSATITLIGKYNKEAVEITSATSDGSGNISVNEGKQGYQAVQIGGGPNKLNSKGTITVKGDSGPVWQAP